MACTCAQVVVDEALLAEVLGPRRFLGHDAEHRVAGPGSVAGLVWTEAGGQVQYVECAATSTGRPGHRGALQLTGQVRPPPPPAQLESPVLCRAATLVLLPLI